MADIRVRSACPLIVYAKEALCEAGALVAGNIGAVHTATSFASDRVSHWAIPAARGRANSGATPVPEHLAIRASRIYRPQPLYHCRREIQLVLPS